MPFTIQGKVRSLKYEVKVRRAEAAEEDSPYAKEVEQRGRIKKCIKCHARRKMINEVCLECINDLRRHHEQYEDIWDIVTPDLEKLENPAILEDFVMLMMQPRGGRGVEAWLGVDADSVRFFWRLFRERVARGVPEALAMKGKCEDRLFRGENSPYAHFIPPEGEAMRPTTDPDMIRRTLRRRAKKAAALAATQAVKEAS